MRVEQGVKVLNSGLDQSIAKLLEIEPDEYVIVNENDTKFHIVIGSIILGLARNAINPCTTSLETAIEIAKALNK